ncbi:MAG: hypothetical protein WAL84_14195 [Candidatus Dormiibacterota bacterium]
MLAIAACSADKATSPLGQDEDAVVGPGRLAPSERSSVSNNAVPWEQSAAVSGNPMAMP